MASRLRQSQSTTDKNAEILKSLMKHPDNKYCADCKTSDHPRWASWNIGVFICIRCSGIHRGMGTHISRVKSADLDSWTDEQTQSMVKWGNRRANKYWEAGLAPGHIPSENKIENFIRTKYDSKRWVLSPHPPHDPVSLDVSDSDSEDSVPLSVVQEKLNKSPLEGSTISHVNTISRSSRTPDILAPDNPPLRVSSEPNLLGNETPPMVSDSIPSFKVQGAVKAVSQVTRPSFPESKVSNSSLLGSMFDSSSLMEDPSSNTFGSSHKNTAVSGVTSRSDLKNRILGLYAPKPANVPVPPGSTLASPGVPSNPSSPPLSTVSSDSALVSTLPDLDPAFGKLSLDNALPQNNHQPKSITVPANLSGLSFGATSAPLSRPVQKPASNSGMNIWNLSAPKGKATQQSSLNPPGDVNGRMIGAGPAGFQLLSDSMPTTTSPPVPRSNFSFAPTSSGASTDSVTSASALGGGFTNPWATSTTTSIAITNPSSNNATGLSDLWGSSSVPSVAPTFGSSAFSLSKATAPSISTGGNALGSENLWNSNVHVNTRKVSTGAAKEFKQNGEGREKTDDDGFGLFETADVWK